MVLHKRMQKSVGWQATKILSSLPFDIHRHNLGIVCGNAIAASRHSNIHELPDMVHINYQDDVFQTTYQTQTMHPFPSTTKWEIPYPLIAVLLPL
uniref:Uncharacterized protein n=1 Tax=Lactuca sativa TaxID=4236 RepID=A0A9R1XFG6_LACSA|nr:hypothetical protein LSAT_V11C400164960 [Lactuca sativa]